MKNLPKRAFEFLGSIALSCILLILLGLLTWLGTLEQVEFGLYEVQKKYFESFVLVHDAGGIHVYDQWSKRPVGTRYIRFKGAGDNGSASNNGSCFYVIM